MNYYRFFSMKIIYVSIMILTAFNIHADVQMPAFFANNMLLQRGKPVPVYGQAAPSEKIVVEFNGQRKETSTNANGKWQIIFDPLTMSSKPKDMRITGNNTIIIRNILVGDLWLASGQSNMEMAVRQVKNAAAEIKTAKYPEIRFFKVTTDLASSPRTKQSGKWLICTPKNVSSLSAVAYFFARELNCRYGVPIGIIESAVGSSSCQAWTPREVLDADKSLPQPLAIAADKYPNLKTYKAFRKEIYQKCMQKDFGIKAECLSWSKPETNTANWKEVKVPGYIESRGMKIDGAVWFRKEVNIPKDWAGKDIRIDLGAIRNSDIVFMNGEKIGSTDSGLKTWIFRRYKIPGKLVKAGKNVIAVRIFNSSGRGGFVTYPAPLKLYKNKTDQIILSGKWKCKIEQAFKPRKLPSNVPSYTGVPTGFYNAMIAPYCTTPIRGFIWYQGESNSGRKRSKSYYILFSKMIKSWRQLWKDQTLPFYFVQLANYKKRLKKCSEGSWTWLREAQLKTLALPHTGMAVAIDVGEATNVHPKNKQDIGKRLAFWARRDCYGDANIAVSGPIYKSSKIEDNRMKIRFSHVYGGLKSQAGKLKGFAIAGADKKFVWADAKINGNSIVVWSDKIKKPVFVRYAWADNPDCNLINSAGLPAVPFRTDK